MSGSGVEKSDIIMDYQIKENLVVHIFLSLQIKKGDAKAKYLSAVEKVFEDMTHVSESSDFVSALLEGNLSDEEKHEIWMVLSVHIRAIVHNNSTVIERMLQVIDSV